MEPCYICLSYLFSISEVFSVLIVSRIVFALSLCFGYRSYFLCGLRYLKFSSEFAGLSYLMLRCGCFRCRSLPAYPMEHWRFPNNGCVPG